MSSYDVQDAKERLRHRLTNHPPVNEETGVQLDAVTSTCIAVGDFIIDTVPECREQSLALTRLEEMSMWMKAGIARNQPE